MEDKTKTKTAELLLAYIETCKAIADAIKELGRVPAGTLYARLMGSMSQETFDGIILQLTGAGFVQRTQAHELVWIGQR